MSSLSERDFAVAYRAVHGHEPFLWQKRLLGQVLADGWPRTIAAPTGTGKTAVIDIALFHLALDMGAKAGTRTAPMRIVFAVDRRIIVDQAFERARQWCDKLALESDPLLRAMASALSRGRDALPLHVEQLRGGMPREDDWARDPAQPTVLCTTVDQLGSRLLFRGYGVSERMAPVHAGLLGEDALLILDEAHLSTAFEDTLVGVDRWRNAEGRSAPVPNRPWHVVRLTATPRRENGIFALNEAEMAERKIAPRLTGPAPEKPFKPTTLEELKAQDDPDGQARAFADRARLLCRDCNQTGAVVAVIVNRVALARRIFGFLHPGEGERHDAILLTGRVRSGERDRLITHFGKRLSSGSREVSDRALFVVATQCVEAGADFDFDALVTQIAPLDALRQRFGRLNRLGSKPYTPAVVLAMSDEVTARAKPDPVYGDRLRAAWDWLNSRATPGARKNAPPTIDFGPHAMSKHIDDEPDGAKRASSEAKNAPVLRRADLFFLAMTSPRPNPDPELSLFLHGELREDRDVSIVWRADLPAEWDEIAELQDEGRRKEAIGRIIEAITLLPPRSGEALAVPIWHARMWLAQATVDDDPLADVPGLEEDTSKQHSRRHALRWRGDESELVEASEIRPGDTIIVPCDFGGCDRFGWAPRSSVVVEDIAELAADPYESRRAVLRLHPALWARIPEFDGKPSWQVVAARLSEGQPPADLLKWLQASFGLGPAAVLGLAEEARAEIANLSKRVGQFADANGADLRLVPYDPQAVENPEAWKSGGMIVAHKGLGRHSDAPAESVTDGDDVGSFRKSPLTLEQHRQDVEAKARDFGQAVGLLPPLVEALGLAARLHDDGKADPRFQAYLRGQAVPTGDLLAKSDRRRSVDDGMARKLSDLPRPWRHEALSVRMAVERLAETVPAEVDARLVLWLIGTHHGHGRPFLRHEDPWDEFEREVDGVILPPQPGPERLDFDWNGFDWPSLFEALQADYGVWGLAYLEAVLRLADHRASEMRDRGPAVEESKA